MMKVETEIHAPKRSLAYRPPLFRALGRKDPPPEIVLQGSRYRRVDIIKHDSWAATAVYANDRGEGVACKFNRMQWLLIMPGRWVGRLLARKERNVLQLMQGLEGFPRWMGPVIVDGRVLPNAVAHEWIEGRTFNYSVQVDEKFFPRLRDMIAKLHAQGIAYVDMSKWENIIVGISGRPYLIDYQIHYRLRHGWPSIWWLRRLQSADRFYLNRHWRRTRPEQFALESGDLAKQCPDIVKIAEAMGHPLRCIRNSILSLARVGADSPGRKSPIRDKKNPGTH